MSSVQCKREDLVQVQASISLLFVIPLRTNTVPLPPPPYFLPFYSTTLSSTTRIVETSDFFLSSLCNCFSCFITVLSLVFSIRSAYIWSMSYTHDLIPISIKIISLCVKLLPKCSRISYLTSLLISFWSAIEVRGVLNSHIFVPAVLNSRRPVTFFFCNLQVRPTVTIAPRYRASSRADHCQGNKLRNQWEKQDLAIVQVQRNKD